MDKLIASFSIVCFLLSLLSAYIVFFINKEQPFSNRLLAILLLLLAIVSFNIAIIHSGYLLEVPFLYRVLIPPAFLLPPVSYLYVRSVLNGETRFRKYDWLVFAGPLFGIINFLPVYLMSNSEKLAIINQYIYHPTFQGRFLDGILPAYLFSFIRTTWCGIFIYYQFRLIKNFRRNVGNEIAGINEDLLHWLWLLAKLFLALLIVFAAVTIASSFLMLGLSVTNMASLLLTLTITLQLFLKPRLLYGVYLPSANYDETLAEPVESGVLDGEAMMLSDIFKKNLEYKEKIDGHFKGFEPFLDPDYTLDDLVREIQLPRHAISSFVNQEYGIGFRKFLNRQRIDYMLRNSSKESWQNLTLEAIALESGFGNRSTFIKNFKEVTGKNPLEYFKKITV
jgi:AraC-like DNA-binding protein